MRMKRRRMTRMMRMMRMRMRMHCHSRRGPVALQQNTLAKKRQPRFTGKVNTIISNAQLLRHCQNLPSTKMMM